MDNLELTTEEQALLEQALQEAHEDASSKTVLPSIPNSILVDESTSRFSSAIWYDAIKTKNILLAGLGGVGSWCALLLSRVKPNYIEMYDSDIVDGTNLSGQLHSVNSIGEYKSTSIFTTMVDFSNYATSFASKRNFTATDKASNIMICGFDNMEARKIFFNTWKNHVLNGSIERRKECLFIDARLAAEEFQIFCIKGDDLFLMEKYQNNYLFDDSEAEETICSYKQTSFCASMVASYIVNLFVNFVANSCEPIIDRDLPFKTYYDASRMYFKTESV